VASFAYRTVVILAIALFVAGRFFVVGVVLALIVVSVQIVAPLLRHVGFVVASPRLAECRPRALLATGGAAAAVAALLLLLPVPLYTRAQGVILPPEGAQVRAGAAGFVARVLVRPDEPVRAGQPLVVTHDPALAADVAVAEARLRQVRARHRASRRADPIRAEIVRDDLEAARAALDRARERAGEGVIRSPGDGRLVAPDADRWQGRYVRKGELLGFVVGPRLATARVALRQAEVALVRDRTRAVEVRLVQRLAEALPARVVREVPAASELLPSAALGHRGGGPFAVDAADPDGIRALEPVFQLDLELPGSVAVAEIGGRVHVRFDHGLEPMAWRGWRAVRRLFLERIGV
jgi:putative peptide zinc metalloprotease protein